LFAASIGFLTLAVAVYANRLEWVTRTPSGGEKIVGRVEQSAGRIKELGEARDRADDRWVAGLALLRAGEQERPGNQKFYAEQLANLKGEGGDGVIRALPLSDGKPIPAGQGEGLQFLGQPAKPLKKINDDNFELLAELQK